MGTHEEERLLLEQGLVEVFFFFTLLLHIIYVLCSILMFLFHISHCQSDDNLCLNWWLITCGCYFIGSFLWIKKLSILITTWSVGEGCNLLIPGKKIMELLEYNKPSTDGSLNCEKFCLELLLVKEKLSYILIFSNISWII